MNRLWPNAGDTLATKATMGKGETGAMQPFTGVDDLHTWKSYYYLAGTHSYRQPRYDPTGGPRGGPCLWADDTMWTIDTPEQPHSILFLLQYRIWNDAPPLNLRGAEVSFRLRGENLALHGGCCYFWIATQLPTTTRWHCTGLPIPISRNQWQEPVTLCLPANPEQWHRSFTSDPANAAELIDALALCVSYGFSFVGFSEKVTGSIGLANFTICSESPRLWPYIVTDQTAPAPWLTASKRRQAIVPVSPEQKDLDPMTSASATTKNAGLSLADDFLVVEGPIPFAYLAILDAGVIDGHDLRNALLIVRHDGTSFDPAEGKICFFVERSASNTRWLLRIPFAPRDTDLYYEMLSPNPAFWVRLSGMEGLEEVLSGRSSTSGYNYFGFMLIEPRGEPSGRWELLRFSIGPTVDARWGGQQGEEYGT